eukprot:CAMPEP_0115769010 /NCGR_PEP_ID=MMETSP0272-20121206/104481_1 /TAXON_ID=71861 /ORGANISM="Scrippsiella trochoidea, Strain CCMP3099" /LENGTH=55 /DNA_ID=CAMNT_0003215067 /DNA_START=711 /DNA_END=875 /DNA_ORIENTATION=+
MWTSAQNDTASTERTELRQRAEAVTDTGGPSSRKIANMSGGRPYTSSVSARARPD